jgi:phosphomannomutase
MLDAQLRARIVAWRDDDPDDATVAQTDALLAAADAGDADAAAELASAFGPFLEFGTAGLRGAIGPGPSRMNRAVVSRAAAGLGAYLRHHDGASAVIGYDARHRSLDFAIDTAEILGGTGVRSFVMPTTLPTPVLAFAIRALDVDAGVMVTASHNPPQDNGYKVYLGDGSQIIPPADADIAAEIAAVGAVAGIARSEDFVMLTHDIVDAYVNAAASIVAPAAPRAIRVVSTSLHGVGHETWMAAMRAAGFRVPSVVLAQAAPDPDFPTVAFPNPEEPGAADMLLAQAAAEGADIAVAHDPDADRCAAGVFDPAISAWRLLTGDELGSLLAWWTIERTSRFDLPAPEGVMACSIVSSTLLLRLAEAAGLDARQTLTGFKWIGRVPGLAFGYEEALGYCVAPDIAADKDGITAGLRVVEMAASLKAEGRTLLDALEAIYTKHGLHATTQLSVRMSDPSAIRDAVQHLREQPPTEIAGRAITGVDDMALGIDGLPPTEGIRLRLADGHVIVRPSGTEPKLKCYLEYITPWTPTAHLWAVQVLEATKADLRIALGL